jgi:hypothetical protein
MGEGGAAERLWDEFRALYEAAGSPTLASLVNLGLQQRPPAQVADSTLSDWLTRRGVPGRQSSRQFLAIVAILRSRAKGSGYEPRPDGWWQQLLKHAQEERATARRAGRPRRQDGPAPAPGRRAVPGVRVADADLRRLGVHAAISVPGVPDEIPPEYIPRDVDDAEFGVRARVAAAAERGGFVLLTGGSSVGKTRCAAEAVRALLPDWRLVHPAGPGEVAALAAAPARRMVVWLDDLQRYMDGEDGLSGGVVRALLGAPDPVVIIGTLWPDRYTAYTTMPAPGGPDPHARERQVVELADVVRIAPAFSAAELDRARAAATRDLRLKEALEAPGYGLTQTLAAAPQLVARWEDAQTAAPYAWAVLTAALDAARLGARAPLTADFLRAAAPGYCTPQQQAEAPDNWFKQALAHTTEELHGAASALSPTGAAMGHVTGYIATDYLVQHASRQRRYERVPASIWDAVLSCLCDPADTWRLAASAENRLLYCYAILLYRHAADAGDGHAAVALAELLARRGEFDEATQILRARARAGDETAVMALAVLVAQRGDLSGAVKVLRPRKHRGRRTRRADASGLDPAVRLADLLARRGDLDRAEQILRVPAASGDGEAAWRLAGLLAGRGDLDGLRARADAGDGHAAAALAGLLIERGDLDELRARADAGDGDAVGRLAGLLIERGDLDQAAQIIRSRAPVICQFADLAGPHDNRWAEHLLGVRVDNGDLFAVFQLAGRGDLDGLRARANVGDEEAASQLAELIAVFQLAGRGDLDGLRARANVGDEEAASQLAKLLGRRKLDQVETEHWRAKADAGDFLAAGQLAYQLAGRGDLDQLRARADAGDFLAAGQLAYQLASRGDLDQLRARADAGHRDAAGQLAYQLASRGDFDQLRARADADDEEAASQLADLLAQRGELDQAEQILRALADAGHRDAAGRLAGLLAGRGDLDGLRARADAGDRHAAEQLPEVLAKQGRGEEAERLRRFGLNPDGSIADA